MIYWDNAATTWPKPHIVQAAVRGAMMDFGANPGRGGHKMSLMTAQKVYECRESVAAFFGLTDPSGVIFTPNCTASLNMVIHGILDGGGRAVISDLEHNAVWRPVNALPGNQSRFDVAVWSADEDELVEHFRRAIRPDTKLMVCTHASNAFGVTFPLKRLAKLAHQHGLLFCVDAAQTAGVLPINMQTDDIDYLCVAAHKGLYAPMGMGLLLCREKSHVPALVQGGTGSQSTRAAQPEELPDRLESGTPNMLGIIGLMAGVRFVERRGVDAICAHEMGLLSYVYERLANTKGVLLYTQKPKIGSNAPVLSVNMKNLKSEQLAYMLDQHYIAVRAGLHCAPLAHRHFGTMPDGTVRLAPSIFSDRAQADVICKLFHQIAQKTLHTKKNML